ncbi:MAG: GvpL/GvpF family gas vesicle protein [Nitrospinae bacterium]|nr:GvpL/GvpF family gas vesicle protein [Nitrospinota bacterium]
MRKGKLLYAIIDGPGAGDLAFTGLDDVPLELVPYRDLAAVASAIDLDVLAGRDDACRKADMVRYQQVNAALLHIHPMVPLRFGFTARDAGHIQEVLTHVYLQLRPLLNRLRGKVELVVQARWSLPKILHDLMGTTGQFTNCVTPLELGRTLFEAVEARRKEFIEGIHAQLSPLTEGFADGLCPEEGMVLNRSYLVTQAKEPLFDAAITRVGEAYAGNLTFRYIGPLPPYSFANLTLAQGNFAQVDRARKALQLPEMASREHIKAAYRRLIGTYHPDRNPGDPAAAERCRAIVEAYQILDAYCQSFQNGERGGAVADYSFRREAVEGVFILKGG